MEKNGVSVLSTLSVSRTPILSVPKGFNRVASVGVQLGGLNLTIGDPVRNVSYVMTIEGDVDETVETESFDIVDDRPDGDH
ncbi:hypothetical protein [Halorubrum sp. PV6]|uniref:hypothetical protein n=1 Tax=Halorubrum sp. PV6 TaxID=634157 RepID=UPI001445F188|nr:hypothetical protein [Halorubrum sp. PV6]